MPVAWALLVFCVQAYLVVLFYLWKATDAAAWSTFNRCLESIFELIILNTMFHGALATWIETPKIIEAVNRLNLFNRVTRRIAPRSDWSRAGHVIQDGG
ncbi:hypothetical protein J6590_092782 [Homalodisca vitripennis]|nr:hypothetical protein J6590_092782 [Homalodisca vitripennis]